MRTVAEWILVAFTELYWWVLLALAWLVLLAVALCFWPFVKQGLQTAAKAPEPVRPLGVAIPGGDWCGCCGRRAPDGARWCFECLDHVDADADTPAAATWAAQYGTVCPFTDAAADGDLVAEGLGATRHHPWGDHVTPLEGLTKGERLLWDEARRGIA